MSNLINLEALPTPDIIEQKDYETILSELIAELQKKEPAYIKILESDPAYKILEVCAYREYIVRQRINNATRGVMIASATGTDLDNLAALLNIERLEITAEDKTTVPPKPATYETDENFRKRIILSFSSFSVAGPRKAYIYFTKTADPRITDVNATSPKPGDVVISILHNVGDGGQNNIPNDLINKVVAVLSAEDVRPLTDNLIVKSAEIKNYNIEATLYFYKGPDHSLALENAKNNINKFVEENRLIGIDQNLSAIYKALHTEGVQRVELASPKNNIIVGETEAPYCTNIKIIDGGQVDG